MNFEAHGILGMASGCGFPCCWVFGICVQVPRPDQHCKLTMPFADCNAEAKKDSPEQCICVRHADRSEALWKRAKLLHHIF